MSENSYKLYMHTSPSGKIYFGITSMNPEKRWDKGRRYNGNKHFTRAINKYGWENIEHIILAEGLTEEEAKYQEIILIAIFNTTNQDKGYNITKGGEGASGYKHTEETKNKISKKQQGRTAWNKGIKATEEQKKKNSEAHLGRHHTDEAKRKIGEAFKGENHPNGKKVKCIETGVIYPTVADANEALGKPRRRDAIGRCARGETKTAYKLHWEYIEE